MLVKSDKSAVLEIFLKLFREPTFLAHWGRAFHNLGAEQENEPLYKAVRDFGTCKELFSDGRRLKEYTRDIEFNKIVI